VARAAAFCRDLHAATRKFSRVRAPASTAASSTRPSGSRPRASARCRSAHPRRSAAGRRWRQGGSSSRPSTQGLRSPATTRRQMYGSGSPTASGPPAADGGSRRDILDIMRSLLGRALLAVALAGCGVAVEPGPVYVPGPPPKVPPGHLPPPGSCRIWFPDRPPGHQPPPGPCEELQYRVPPGAYLIRG
jgi:hypothetical protein